MAFGSDVYSGLSDFLSGRSDLMKALTSIPMAPRPLPLLGHLMPLVRDPLGLLRSLPANGELVRVRLGPAQAVVACDPGLTWQVLQHDRVFDKGGFFFERVEEVLGDGVGTCPYSRHRRQRRLLQPAFHPQRIRDYTRIMTDQVGAVTGTWRDGQILDVAAQLTEITSMTIVSTMFGNALPPPILRQAIDDFRTLFGGIYRRVLTPRPLDRLPTPFNRRYQRANARLRRILERVITARRAGSGGDRGDLLSALLFARDQEDNSQGLSDTEILDQVVSLFIAGAETAAATLGWALHLLAEHPDIHDRLTAEVDQVLAGRPATHADLPRLEFTSRVITETLRLWPPGWLLTRTVTADTELAGHRIPAGTSVVFSPYLLHHRSDFFERADRFDPDRWLPGRADAIPRHAYIPFGGGARKCMGDTFGFTEAILALATITSGWHLQSLSDQKVRPAIGATLHPKGLRMLAIARDSTNSRRR